MSWQIGCMVLITLLLTGMPIAVALTLVGSLGVVSIIGWSPALSLLGSTFFDSGRNYTLSILPLFLMMGNFVVLSGVAQNLYNTAHAWLRHRQGGLAMATVVACGGFSSVCGSSMATAATMSKIALPSMRRFGYPDSLSTASIAAGGTLGILIPPSVMLVFYGILTQQDIGKLFLAGLIPGVLGIIGYTLAVMMSVRFGKQPLTQESKLPLKERLLALRGTLGALALFAFVMGGIYFGIFTPTESAAMGAAGALLLAIVKKKCRLQDTLTTLLDTAKTTTAMFFILFGALTFSHYVNLSGMTQDIQDLLTVFGDNPTSVILMILCIYLVLGCMFESLSMMMLTVPIFYPIVAAQGFDLIWFGIFVIVVTEISYITPPIGMNAFVLRSVVQDVKLATVFKGLIPFVSIDLVRLLLLLLFPAIALWLPSHI